MQKAKSQRPLLNKNIWPDLDTCSEACIVRADQDATWLLIPLPWCTSQHTQGSLCNMLSELASGCAPTNMMAQLSAIIVAALLPSVWLCVQATGCRKAPSAESQWCGLPNQLSNFQGG